MLKKILLTGATGFIGSHILEALIDEGYEVIILKRSSSNPWRIKNSIEKCVSYDIDKVELSEIFQNHQIDAVLHLATTYRKQHQSSDIKEMVEGIITFPTLILEQMKSSGIKYFINAGTFFEYPSNNQITEKTKRKAFNLYASFKVSFSEILKYYCDNGMKAFDLKLFSPYGPKDNEKLIVYAIKNLIDGKPLELTEGTQKLSWTYVSDIVDAFLKSLKAIENYSYEVINIASPCERSIKDIIGSLKELSGSESEISFNRPIPKGEITYSSSDISKAKKILGWSPKISIQQGLEKTYDYYKVN